MPKAELQSLLSAALQSLQMTEEAQDERKAQTLDNCIRFLNYGLKKQREIISQGRKYAAEHSASEPEEDFSLIQQIGQDSKGRIVIEYFERRYYRYSVDVDGKTYRERLPGFWLD